MTIAEPKVSAQHQLPIERVPLRWLIVGFSLLVVSSVAAMLIGPAHLAPSEVLRELARHLPFASHAGTGGVSGAIVWQIRAPRIVLAGLVGAMLALAGATYQGVFANPLADPYLLGTAAGAELGATIAIAYAPEALGINAVPVAAFICAVGAVAAVVLLGRSLTSGTSGRGTTVLILAGVAVGAFLTAIETYVQQQHSNAIRQIYSFILGRLSTAGWSGVRLVLPYVVVAAVAIVLHRRHLDALSLGDDEAASLGINVSRTRLLLVAAATIGTAAVVAVSGTIGFVGIIIPHTIRLLTGGSYRTVVPLSVVFGAGFLILADLIARTAVAPAELPIGVITALVGAPFFIVLLRRSRAVT